MTDIWEKDISIWIWVVVILLQLYNAHQNSKGILNDILKQDFQMIYHLFLNIIAPEIIMETLKS